MFSFSLISFFPSAHIEKRKAWTKKNERLWRKIITLFGNGRFKQAIEKFEIVEKEAKENFINDLDLAAFYGDFAEIQFERGEFEKSARLFEESLKIIEGLLNEISNSVDVAFKADIKTNFLNDGNK